MSLITINVHADLEEVEKKLNKILSNQTFIINTMPTKAEFQAVAQEFRDAFLNISNDITRLTDALGNPGLTDAEEAEILAEFRTLAADAKALAERTAEPPVEPEP